MRICFYYEYKNIVGGLTSLFITLIKELRKQNVEVVLFNYTDGLIAKELKSYGTEIIIIDIDKVNWKELDKLVYSTDVFVVTGFIEVFHHFFKINPKLVLYNINDYLCDISKYKFGINSKYQTRNLISELIKKDSLLLMDDTGIRNADEKLQLKITDPLFLPVPVTVPHENIYLQKKDTHASSIRLTYIGRSVDWKMYPLKKILDDLKKVNKQAEKKIVFSIVVDSIDNLKKFIDVERYKAAGVFEILLYENIRPSDIDAFLLENSDLNFGMGTSTLEGGKLGIPSILMDFSTKDLPADYKYSWLYHATYFSLGRNAEKSYTPPSNAMSMAELIAHYIAEDAFIRQQSAKSYSYVKNHHSVEHIVASLINYAQKAKFRFLSAKPYNFHYSFLHRQIKRLVKSVKKV